MTEDYGTAKWVEREDAHARQMLSTAKVVVTFSSGIAAAFVSAALQKDDKGVWSIFAAALLLLALMWTLRVLLKRKSEVGPGDVEGKPPGEVQAALKTAALADKTMADSAHGLMVRQVFLCLASSVTAAIELFS